MIRTTRRIAAGALLLGLAAAPAAFAQQGDADAGRLKVYTCTGCHGIPYYKNIYPHYSVPKIGGQNFEYLVAALTAYRKGEREHPTMQAQAQGYSEQDILDIATYLSGLGKPADAAAAE
jgi:cytochrome c553